MGWFWVDLLIGVTLGTRIFRDLSVLSIAFLLYDEGFEEALRFQVGVPSSGKDDVLTP